VVPVEETASTGEPGGAGVDAARVVVVVDVAGVVAVGV